MKKIICILFLVLFSCVAFAQNVYPSAKETAAEKGPWKFTHYDSRINVERFKVFVYMENPFAESFAGMGRGGYPPYLPRATAYVRSSASAGYPTSTITVNTKDLPSSFSERCFFEVWTVDDDTGFAMSHGMFFTSLGGSAEFEVNYNNYMGAYDRIVITKEPFYDDNPLPGEVMLEGVIEKPFLFRPVPKQTLMIDNSITERTKII